jgi:hypothetical protein
MLGRHVFHGYSSGDPGTAALREFARVNPNVIARVEFSDINILVGKDHDRPSFYVDDYLLPSRDGLVRPAFELPVIGLPPPCLRCWGCT